jgi:hypothetical protein
MPAWQNFQEQILYPVHPSSSLFTAR